MRVLTTTLLIVAALAASPRAAQQVEIDRTLERVYGTAIMASDVRQARLLRLVPEAGASDKVVQTALENRLLILREVARVEPKEPTAQAIALRREAWRALWPIGTDLPALMVRAGMTDQALDGWFRDDLRISDYLEQRFGHGVEADRGKLMADWLSDLRRRANLSGK